MSEDEDESLAPLIAPSDYTFDDLSQFEFYHFLLKCTDGLFKGKFFYINTSSEGETIGGGDYVFNQNNNLTLHIEKAELSDKHCSIKFTPQYKYILNDLGSTDGTWVKVFDLNLLTENKERIYRVSDFEFVFRDVSESESSNGSKGASGKQSREDSKSSKSRSSDSSKQLKMIIRNRKDKSSKTIRITGDKSLVFGSSAKADYQLEGDKIAEFHFEITKNFLLRNLNHNISESYGLYKCLFPEENYMLRPGHGIRIGNLEFHVERFNTGIVSDKGGRPYLEDCYA